MECIPSCDADSYCVRGTCLPYVTAPRQVYLPDGVTPLDGVVDLDAGDRHTCAIRFDGTVWCWGANGSAELAQDSAVMVNSQVARQVASRWAGGASQLTVGGSHACIRADGDALWCWGSNVSNENGTGVPYTIVARPLLAPVR
ncbi:MAG: RCC1 domain-containing protein [Polyangiales bacterium]